MRISNSSYDNAPQNLNASQNLNTSQSLNTSQNLNTSQSLNNIQNATSNNELKFSKFNSDTENNKALNSQRFICGVVSGTITAFIFNPWDKALYLSVINQRALFTKQNWIHPFIGSGQSMIIRTISGSMFFPLKEYFDDKIHTISKLNNWNLNQSTISFLSGNFAGMVNGFTLNSINAIKYHTWNERKSFIETLKYMYKKGGLTPFLRGKSATIIRDTIFGGTYSLIKNYLEHLFANKELNTKFGLNYKNKIESINQLLIPFIAASIGTAISSPLNYTRNHMYGTKPGDRIPTSNEILKELWRDACNQQEMNRIRYISMRFRLGAATTRVGCGMAFGQFVYDKTKSYIFNIEDEDFN